jgi:hypothetical protein
MQLKVLFGVDEVLFEIINIEFRFTILIGRNTFEITQIIAK